MVISRDVRFTDSIQNPDQSEESLELLSRTNRNVNPLLIEEENSKSLKADNE